GVDLLELRLLDVETLLDLFPVRNERRVADALHPVVLAPEVEHALGRAEAGGPVDDRAAADRAALHDLHALIGREATAAVLIEARHHRGLFHVEVAALVEAAFLEHHHALARPREPLGHV